MGWCRCSGERSDDACDWTLMGGEEASEESVPFLQAAAFEIMWRTSMS
jgi:hypothetical protein